MSLSFGVVGDRRAMTRTRSLARLGLFVAPLLLAEIERFTSVISTGTQETGHGNSDAFTRCRRNGCVLNAVD
jgi:hypothetical protein